jgi:hypothetical protein
MSALSPKKCKIEVGEDSYTADITSWKFSAADADSSVTTFADADAGGSKDHTFNVTLVQDDAADSFWSFIYDHAGEDCTVTVMPHGNATPSVTEPHWTATGTVAQFDGDYMGGDADANPRAKWTADGVINLDAKPARVTTGP